MARRTGISASPTWQEEGGSKMGRTENQGSRLPEKSACGIRVDRLFRRIIP
jgi:hypothetical protein